MSKGGNSGGTQTQTSQTQLPDWVNNASYSNYQRAQDVANNLLGPYTGQRVANLTPEQLANIGLLQNNIGSTTPAFNTAGMQTNALMGFNPSMITPQTLAGTNLQPYMNPYTQSVIDPSMKLLQQQNAQSLNAIGDQARSAGAFGGSRQGVAEGVQNAQTNLLAGQLGAQLYGQNFQQAQAAAGQDISNNMAAQQLNQAAGLQGAQFQGNMANQLASLAQGQQQNWLTGMQAAMGGQQQLTAQQQAQLNAQMQQYAEQQQYPIQQLQILQNALQVSPYGTSSTTTGPGPQTNSAMGILGGLSSIAGIAGSLAPFFGFSDRRLKTDIKRVGTDDATELPIYSFRYRGDPKTYPKIVGPMAQDIEKKFPGQVIDIGGRKAVNMNFLNGMMARAA